MGTRARDLTFSGAVRFERKPDSMAHQRKHRLHELVLCRTAVRLPHRNLIHSNALVVQRSFKERSTSHGRVSNGGVRSKVALPRDVR
jgi:hypothetical protein